MAWRFLRAYERRQRPSLDESTTAQLIQVEDSMLRIDWRVNALAEEHRFLTRVVERRQDATSPAPGRTLKPTTIITVGACALIGFGVGAMALRVAQRRALDSRAALDEPAP